MPATYLRSAGSGRWTGSVVRPWRLTLLVAGLSMFGPLSIDAILPAFPAMGAGLGADKLAMQQTISVYLISYALMSMVHGPLSDAMGRRRVLIGGLMMFVLASVGCAHSARTDQLLAFSALPGLLAGVGLVSGCGVCRSTQPGALAQGT